MPSDFERFSMVGQGKDDCSFSLVTYVADKVSEDPVLNGKISGDEAPFPGMLPSLRVWQTSYQLEVSLHAWYRLNYLQLMRG
jgi:hypothetical protein